MVPPDREVSPEIQENARRFEEYRDTPRTGDDRGVSPALREDLNAYQILDAHREGIINETEAWDRLNGLIRSGRISAEEGLNDANRLRGIIATQNRQDGQVGFYNEDGSVNVRLPDGTMTTTRANPNELGNLLNQVEDGIVSKEEALAIVDAFEVNLIYPEEADEFRNMLDMLPTNLVD